MAIELKGPQKNKSSQKKKQKNMHTIWMTELSRNKDIEISSCWWCSWHEQKHQSPLTTDGFGCHSTILRKARILSQNYLWGWKNNGYSLSIQIKRFLNTRPAEFRWQ